MKHSDGSECFGGSGNAKIPDNFVPCCDIFKERTKSCQYDLRYEYWNNWKRWVVIVPDGGSSGIKINFCPHCGFNLLGVIVVD